MKPQITNDMSDGMYIGGMLLQRSCGMKPQITADVPELEEDEDPGFKGAAA